MGWLLLVGSIKSEVFFAEYSLFYRALLRRRPMILSILFTVATHSGNRFRVKNISDISEWRIFGTYSVFSRKVSTPVLLQCDVV